MRNSTQRLQTLLASLSLLLAACDQQLPAWNAGKVVVIVSNTAQCAGVEFERELVQLFADQLHTTVEMVSMPRDKIRRALRKHKAHLAAASLRSEPGNTALLFGPGYQTVREQVICNRDAKLPQDVDDLTEKRLMVPTGSAQEIALKEAHKKSPGLHWQVRRGATAKDLLRDVDEGVLDCTVANELQFADARNYYSNLAVAFDIGSPSVLAWAFPGDADPELLREVQKFFASLREDGTLNRLLERYYGHKGRLKPPDAASFITNVRKILPNYRAIFEEAAALIEEDWRLLAALAYHESQWNPLATSFTNVRGMMMLTEETADRMKVNNRLDARESILAGAKYLALLKEQMPARITEPDRTWLALAAYNQGFGHLEDARILTQRAGMSPDSWMDVKKWMPLLNRPGYYETLKHGYARGGEAVILVESIRNYYDMLKWLEPAQHSVDSGEVSYQLLGPLEKLPD